MPSLPKQLLGRHFHFSAKCSKILIAHYSKDFLHNDIKLQVLDNSCWKYYGFPNSAVFAENTKIWVQVLLPAVVANEILNRNLPSSIVLHGDITI